MSKPVVFDKSRWDVSTGLDYGGGELFSLPIKYVHHQFPPLSKNIELVSETDLDGRGDTLQMAKKGDYLFVGHVFSGGVSVVDVRDPSSPRVVKFIPTDSPHVWSLKCRVAGDILVIANEWKFFEPDRYCLPGHSGPKEPIETGIKVYDVSNPASPQLLSFFKTGQWTKEGGGVSCHRFWFDGHYAYLSASAPGFSEAILRIVDLSDPRRPRDVSMFWRRGQWAAGGEKPWWPSSARVTCHMAIAQGDRAYVAWYGLGGTILDISNIRVPTLVSEFNFNMGGAAHTFQPIKDRQFAMFVDEDRFVYMLDISNERSPRIVGMFPRPPKELLERGVGELYGPGFHCTHENPPCEDSMKSDDVAYVTAQCAGLRIYDITDPYRVSEIGYYVPGTPKVYYSPFGAEGGNDSAGMNVTDVFVDKKGLIYITGYSEGLKILEFDG